MPKNKLFLIVLIVLLVMPIVLSAHIQVFVGNNDGLEIEYPKIDIFEKDSNFTFNFHVYNKSNGYPLTNTTVSCEFHLFDDIGNHIVATKGNEIDFEDIDFEIYVNENNFTTLGEYSYIFQCNDSWQGGFVSASFIVTTSGTIPSTAQGIIYSFLMLLSLCFLGLCLFGAVTINGKNEFDLGGKLLKVNFNKYIKQGLFFLTYLFLILTTFLAVEISTQFLTLNFALVVFELLHTTLWIILLPIFIGFVAVSLVRFVADMKLWELSKRGLKPR